MPTTYSQIDRVLAGMVDWANGVTERMEWKTDVLRKRDSSEQRIILRDFPRMSLDFELTLTREQAASFDRQMWEASWQPWIVPYWPLITSLEASAAANTTVLSADTVDRCFLNGQPLVITSGRGATATEYAVIDSHTNSTVTLLTGTANAWGKGTYLIPAAEGFIQDGGKVKSSYLTADVMNTKLSVAFNPTNSIIQLTTGAVVDTYLGSELLIAEPNWVDAGDYEVEHTNLKYIEADVGVFHLPDFDSGTWSHPFSKPPEETLEYAWFLRGRSAIQSFRQFLMRRAGRANAFWCPSFKSDFILSSNVTGGTATFTATFNNAPPAVEGRRDVIFMLKDGSYVTKRITNVVDNNNWTATITVDSNFSSTILKTSVYKICYLNWARLGSDSAEIAWEHPMFAKGKMTISFIPEL